MSEAISYSTHPDLLTRFGFLPTLEHMAEIIDTTLHRVGKSTTRQKQLFALAFASVRRQLVRLAVR